MHYHIHALRKGWFAMHSGQNVCVVNGEWSRSKNNFLIPAVTRADVLMRMASPWCRSNIVWRGSLDSMLQNLYV